MKVIVISDSLSHSGYISGVGTVIESILQMLSLRDDAVVIGPAFPGCEMQPGVWLPSIKLSRGYRISATLLPSVSSILKKEFEKADIVHIHSVSPLALKALSVLERMPSKQRPGIIWHLHTQADEYLRKWFGVFADPFVYGLWDKINWGCNIADEVIVPTDHFASTLCKTIILGGKMTVWPAPIILPESAEITREQFVGDAFPEDAIILYFIGRAVPEKNLDFLLRVLSGIKSSKICLAVAGGGQIDHFKKAARKLGIGDRVHYLGPKPRAECLSFCRYAHIGVTASVTETQGLALLEQMAMGMPVIVPRGTCFDKPVGQSGGGEMLPLDEALWAKAIDCLAKDASYRFELGQAGARFVNEEYSLHSCFAKLEKVYNRLCLKSCRLALPG